MTFTNPIIAAGLSGLVELYANRVVTPMEACEAYLSRIAGLDGALGAYVQVDAEGARAAAAQSAARWADGAPLSPVDGVPIGIKANIAIEGLAWTGGIGAFRARIAEEDAACIANLRAAGAVILGVLNMHEGAFGATTDNPWFGRTHNPWKHGATAGGSSGGSGAAVAAGLCAAALGSDTLGSVRIPSGFCGIYGHKPTQGLISSEGVMPMSWTLDHVGTHGRSPEDCGTLLAAACEAETELAFEISQPSDMEMLVQTPFAALDLASCGVPCDAGVAAAYAATVQRARAAGLEVETIALEGYDFYAAFLDGVHISAAESAAEFEQVLASDPEGFSPGYRGLLATADTHSAKSLAKAYRSIAAYGEAMRDRLTPYGGILMPTTPAPAPSFPGEPEGVALFTSLGNILGLPATAFPVGLNGEGLPLSVQALAWDDETALGLAKALGIPFEAPAALRG